MEKNLEKNLEKLVESAIAKSKKIESELESELEQISGGNGNTGTNTLHSVKNKLHRGLKRAINTVPHEIKSGNWPEKFAVSLNRFLRFLNNGPKYNKTWFNLLPQTIMFVLPGKNGWEEQERQIVVITKQDEYRYKITQFCKECRDFKCEKKIDDSVGDKSVIPGYLQDGNLQEFMEWYQKTGLNIADINNKVHIVTHSNVMKGYFKKHFKIKKNSETIKNIKATNVCRFVTTIDQKIMPTIIRGVEIDKEKAKDLEKEAKAKKISLCGYGGVSIKARPICGKKTKKMAFIQGLQNRSKTKLKETAKFLVKRANSFGKKTRKIRINMGQKTRNNMGQKTRRR